MLVSLLSRTGWCVTGCNHGGPREFVRAPAWPECDAVLSAGDGATEADGELLGDSSASGVLPPTGVSAGRHSAPGTEQLSTISIPGQELQIQCLQKNPTEISDCDAGQDSWAKANWVSVTMFLI